VLVVRGNPDLSTDDHMQFGRAFGEIGLRKRGEKETAPGAAIAGTAMASGKDPGAPAGAPAGIMYVSNYKVNGRYTGVLPDGEMQFHIDQCYSPTPSIAGCLYALEIPKVGGDTMFGNLYRAWETLPEALKRAVEGREATHVYDHALYGSQTREINQAAPDLPSATYPIVRTHPATGRKLLYVNRLMTARIVGMDESESEDVLIQLFDHQEQPELIYTHRWQVGDLLLWDNRCTIHARTDFDPSEARHLRRFTLQPFAA